MNGLSVALSGIIHPRVFYIGQENKGECIEQLLNSLYPTQPPHVVAQDVASLSSIFKGADSPIEGLDKVLLDASDFSSLQEFSGFLKRLKEYYPQLPVFAFTPDFVALEAFIDLSEQGYLDGYALPERDSLATALLSSEMHARRERHFVDGVATRMISTLGSTERQLQKALEIVTDAVEADFCTLFSVNHSDKPNESVLQGLTINNPYFAKRNEIDVKEGKALATDIAEVMVLLYGQNPAAIVARTGISAYVAPVRDKETMPQITPYHWSSKKARDFSKQPIFHRSDGHGDYGSLLLPIRLGDEITGVFCVSKLGGFSFKDYTRINALEHAFAVQLSQDGIRKLLKYDGPTGYLRKEWGEKNLEIAVSEMMDVAKQKNIYASVSTIHFDMDNFKKTVNDVYGQPGGDKVIKILADRIRAGVKEYGIRSSDVEFVRDGGEEFYLILKYRLDGDSQSNTEAFKRMTFELADFLRKKIEDPDFHFLNDPEGKSVQQRVTISIGTSTYVFGNEETQTAAEIAAKIKREGDYHRDIAKGKISSKGVPSTKWTSVNRDGELGTKNCVYPNLDHPLTGPYKPSIFSRLGTTPLFSSLFSYLRR